MPTARTAPSPHSPHTHASDSSDYLLLTTTEHSPLLPSSASSAPTSSPNRPRPPRAAALVQLAALADTCTTVALALRVPVTALPPSAVALNVARGLVVAGAVAVASGAHLAPVMMGQLVLSTLVLLYRLNELVQTTTLPPGAWLNPTTVWYLASFALALVDYAVFLAVVGARRRRRGWAGGEQRWDGNVERVSVGGARSERSASVGGASTAAGEGEGGWDPAGSEGDGSEPWSSDDDADDLVDVPPRTHLSSTSTSGPGSGEHGLRNRASRASLLSALSPPLALGDEERPGFGASRGYGSIRSLAGI